MDEVRIEPFDARIHERTRFDCGNPELNQFLRSLVTQYERRQLGRTYIASHTVGTRVVLGYYTLAASAISFKVMPHDIARKLPRHPVPAVLLARLAVDISTQRMGLGAVLVADAILKAQEASKLLGTFAIEVLAADTHAAVFYERFGFAPLLDDPKHLYLSMSMVGEQIARIRSGLA